MLSICILLRGSGVSARYCPSLQEHPAVDVHMSKRPSTEQNGGAAPKVRVRAKGQNEGAKVKIEVPAMADEAKATMHPTMQALHNIFNDTDFAVWLREQGTTAVSFGGLPAFDPARFEVGMMDGEYNCTMHATAILGTQLTHDHLVPGMASINRVMDMVWNRDSAARGGRQVNLLR